VGQVLQLRSKKWDRGTVVKVADVVYSVSKDFGVPFIINDYVDIAAGYDGVHIGAEDVPYEEARRVLGEDKIVGVSCYGSLATALKMQEAGADYVAFSSPYPSPTKPYTLLRDRRRRRKEGEGTRQIRRVRCGGRERGSEGQRS